MEMNISFWDFETAAASFLIHHIAIVGLIAAISYYCLRLLDRLKWRLQDSHLLKVEYKTAEAILDTNEPKAKAQPIDPIKAKWGDAELERQTVSLTDAVAYNSPRIDPQ